MPFGPQDAASLSEEDRSRLAHHVMRRQAALSASVAAVFLILVFGLPMVNYLFPEAANAPVFGFPANWLFLGVLFYPITWLLSAVFIRRSDQIEAECADWRAVLGIEQGEPLEPEGIDDVKPAFLSDEERLP